MPRPLRALCAAVALTSGTLVGAALLARPSRARASPPPAAFGDGDGSAAAAAARASAGGAAGGGSKSPEPRPAEPSIPPDVLQFLSLFAYQALTVGGYLVVFALLRRRARWLPLLAPHRPDGPIGRARGVCAWLARIARTRDDELCEAGGVDGVLHVRAARAHARLSAWLCVTSLPLIAAYATAPGGDLNGFSRLAMSNVLAAEAAAARAAGGATGHEPAGNAVGWRGDGWTADWRRWATVVAVWANALLALRAADALDARVARLSAEYARVAAPLHAYALVLHDLPPSVGAREVAALLRAVLGADAVVSSHLVRRFSAGPDAPRPSGARKLEAGARTLAACVGLDRLPLLRLLLTGRGGLREAVSRYEAALAALAARERSAAPPAGACAAAVSRWLGEVGGGGDGLARARARAADARADVCALVAAALKAEADETCAHAPCSARRRAARAVGAEHGGGEAAWRGASAAGGDGDGDGDGGVDGDDEDGNDGGGGDVDGTDADARAAAAAAAAASAAAAVDAADADADADAADAARLFDVASCAAAGSAARSVGAPSRARAPALLGAERALAAPPAGARGVGAGAGAGDGDDGGRGGGVDALRDATEPSRSVIVVLNSLARACVVATAPLVVNGGRVGGDDADGDRVGAPRANEYVVLARRRAVADGMLAVSTRSRAGCALLLRGARAWRAAPLGEPRDVLWRALEELPQAHVRARRAALLGAAKAGAFATWSVLVGGLAAGVQLLLAQLAHAPVAWLRVGATALAGIAPVIINNGLLVLMAPLLADLAERYGGLWRRSALAEAVQRDYLWFLRTVGFAAPLLASSVASSLLELSRSPSSLLGLLASNVPASASFFLSYVLLRAAYAASEALGVVRVLLCALRVGVAGCDVERARAAEPPPSRREVAAAWGGFAHLVMVTYAPIAPVLAPVALLYFCAAGAGATLATAAVERSEFESGGRLARLQAAQAADNVAIAAFVQAATLALAGGQSATGVGPFCAITPLALLVVHYRGRIAQRQATGLFGAARGVLPLADAAAVDDARPKAQLREQLLALGRERRAWAPPCAPQLVARQRAPGAAPPPLQPGGVSFGRGASLGGGGGGGDLEAGASAPPPPLPLARRTSTGSVASLQTAAEDLMPAFEVGADSAGGEAARARRVASGVGAGGAQLEGGAEARLEALLAWQRRYDAPDATAYVPPHAEG
ncbi:hypothetical protein KFE25_005008 [Diacronema lutheri]|uniref:CSC1/OSCA1-like 7TM region domain-containing protein n=1 Tax=Diacronema lutheri TaxID=2081491 RepID=A0A8J5XGI8_DIALT|nr:hypothetical protein KFE25_005008 [Diacronema lutheri]